MTLAVNIEDLLNKQKIESNRYLHACLMYIQGEALTNSSLRDRFNVKDSSAGSISRLIKESVVEGRIKPLDPETAKRYMRYIPSWA